MPDRMPNRMSEDMSDRMPEDVPVRTCINVMVGITRSKVIFFCGLLLILSPHKVAKVFALPQLFSTPRHKAKWLWLWLWRLRPELLERLERLGRRGGTCGNQFGQGTSKGGPTQIPSGKLT